MSLISQKMVFEASKQAVEKQIDYLENSHWRKRLLGTQWYGKNIQLIEKIRNALDSAIVAIENLEKDFNDQAALDSLTEQLETISKIHLTPTIQTNSRWKKTRIWLEKDHSVRKKSIELLLSLLLVIGLFTIPFPLAWLGFCVAVLLTVPFAAKEIKKAKMLTKKHLKKATEDIQRAGIQIQLAVSEHKLCLQKEISETREQPLQQEITALKQELVTLSSEQCLLKQRFEENLQEIKALKFGIKKEKLLITRGQFRNRSRSNNRYENTTPYGNHIKVAANAY